MTNTLSAEATPRPAGSHVARIGALVGGLAGLMVLAGWAFDIPSLRGGLDARATHPATAVLFVLAALSLWDSDPTSGPPWRRGLGFSATLAFVVAAATVLLAPMVGLPPGLDSAAFRSWLVPLGDQAPKPMSGGSALIYVVMGLALVLLRQPREVWRLLGRAIGLFLALIGMLLLAAYAYRMMSGGMVPSALSRIAIIGGFLALGVGLVAGGAPAARAARLDGDGGVLRNKVNLVLAFAIGILLLTGGVSTWAAIRTQSYTAIRKASLLRRTQLTTLLVSLQEVEAGRRRELLAGHEGLLEPYRRALEEFARDATPDRDSVQVRRLALLQPLVETRLEELTRAFRLRGDGRSAEADSLVLIGSGREMLGQVRGAIATMAREEDALVMRWDGHLGTALRVSLFCGIFGGLVAIFFLFLAGKRINDDIRQRAEAEKERDRFFALSVDMLCIANADGTFRRISPAFTATLGWSEEEMLSRPLLHLVHPEDREATRQEFATMNGDGAAVFGFENRCSHRDGSWRVLSWRWVRQPDGTAYGTARDVTEARAAEEALRGLKEAAEAANRAKSEFLAKMSHELRTPLNSIIGFSEILEEERVGPLTTKQRRYVSNVLVSGRNLLQLINDILDLSKVEAGRMELLPEVFEARAALEQVRTIVTALAERKSIALDLALPEDLPALRADQVKFKQIMYNLLGNAIKFTSDGGRITVAAQVVAAANGQWIEIAVEDTGIGIPPEDLGRIFGEFEQVLGGHGSSQQGTGLGLALTEKLVQLHGGSITVESTLGRGSVFRFTLPCEIARVEAEIPEAPMPRWRRGERVEPVVLVIEDDPQARELIGHYLNEVGYAVEGVAGGKEGVERAQSLLPDAITLDMALPDQDGLIVLAQLKTNPATRNIPVVVVSMAERCEMGFSLGAVEWLVKPVERPALLRCLEEAMHRPRPEVPRVLVIDDEPNAVQYATEVLELSGCHVLSAGGGKAGIDLAVVHIPDVIVLDLCMPEVNGFEVVRALRADPRTRDVPVLVVTAMELTQADKEQLLNSVQAIVTKGWREEFLAELTRLCPLSAHATVGDGRAA